jgi:hypothetical protein
MSENKKIMKMLTTLGCKMDLKSKNPKSKKNSNEKIFYKNARRNFFVLDFFDDLTYLKPKKLFQILR